MFIKGNRVAENFSFSLAARLHIEEGTALWTTEPPWRHLVITGIDLTGPSSPPHHKWIGNAKGLR